MKKANLFLALNEWCNLDCSYCNVYKTKKSLTFEQCKQAYIYFLKQYTSFEGYNVFFMGGEPMLSYPDIVKSILFLESLSKSLGKSISFGMPTNTTLLTRTSLEFFKKHQVSVSLSIDSLNSEYDYRNIRGSEISSVPILLRNIELFQEYRDILRIKIVVMPDTVPYLRSTFAQLRTLGFDFINIQPAHGVFWSDAASDEFTKAYGDLLGLALNDPTLRSAVFKGTEQSDRQEFIGCAKGRSEICIDSYGKVFVCDAFLAFPYPKRAEYAHDILE
jgi:sulfatase maturation enzyme AslB (radical SAM superfamily)